MKRLQNKIAAYACGHNGETCQHAVKGSHGYHNEEWVYVVALDDWSAALSMCVGSGIYTPDTPPMSDKDKPGAYSWALHVSFPTTREDVKAGEPSTVCEYVRGGRCTVPFDSCLDAGYFFAEYFDKAAGYEQPDRFWSGLEAKLTEVLRDVHDASVEWSTCVYCDATGTVRK